MSYPISLDSPATATYHWTVLVGTIPRNTYYLLLLWPTSSVQAVFMVRFVSTVTEVIVSAVVRVSRDQFGHEPRHQSFSE